jgi:hypothetical protein
MNALRRLTDGVIPQAVITGSLSFAHIHDLANIHGQTGWKAWTYPLSVDLLMVAAYREVIKARHAKRGGTVLPWVWFLLALAASLSANVIATGGRDLLSIAVGVWPAVAFLGCTLLGHSRPAPADQIQSAEVPVSPPAPAPDVRADVARLDVAQESAELPRAVEGSAVAALAPAEPQTPAVTSSPAPAPAPDVPEVAPELLDYAARIAAEHHDRHGQPIPLAALRSRLGVAPALAQAVHARLTAA